MFFSLFIMELGVSTEVTRFTDDSMVKSRADGEELQTELSKLGQQNGRHFRVILTQVESFQKMSEVVQLKI